MHRIISIRVVAAPAVSSTVAVVAARGYLCRTPVRRSDVLGSGASGNILGTGSFPADFVRELHQDVVDADERRSSIAQPFSSSIRKAELDHMESPEADERHLKKLSKMTDDLFARIPTPEDPMAAALAPTKDEVKEREKFEVLKEAVRDRYRAQQQRQQQEDGRIAAAMMAVEKGTYDRAKYGTPTVDARKYGCDGVYEARPVEYVESSATAPATTDAKKGPSPPLTAEERRRLLNDEDDEDTIVAAVKGRGAFASLVSRFTGRGGSAPSESATAVKEGAASSRGHGRRRKTVEEEEQEAIEAMLADDAPPSKEAPFSLSARSRAAIEAGGVAPIGAWTATEENTMTGEDAEKLKLLLELEATRRKMKALEDALKAKKK
jgi:hypothetical protein